MKRKSQITNVLQPHNMQYLLFVFYHPGYEKMAEILLDNGASYVVSNDENISASKIVHSDAQNGNIYICFSAAIWRCKRHCSDSDTYPWSLVSGDEEIIDLLSQSEANIRIKNKEADKLLLHAAEKGKNTK